MAKKKKNNPPAPGKINVGKGNPAKAAAKAARVSKKEKKERAAKFEAAVAPDRIKNPSTGPKTTGATIAPLPPRTESETTGSSTPPAERAPNDESYRQETIKTQKEKDLAEIGNKEAGAKYSEQLKELPTASTNVPQPKVETDTKLTPKVEEEKDPSAGQQVLEQVLKSPRARSGTGPVTFSHPMRQVTGADVNVTEEPTIAKNLTERMSTGMGLPGSENGVLDHALALAQRDARKATETRKVVNGIEPDTNITSHAGIVGGHHHRLAKVMHSTGLSEEQLTSLATHAGMRLDTALTGGINIPGTKVKSRGLHEMVQEHEDSKRHITQTTSEGDLMEHPDGSVRPVAAGMQLTRTKGKVTKVTRNMHTGELEVSNPMHVGWDKFKGQGGKTIWRNYKEPHGIDLIDHLTREAITIHNEGSARKSAADKASEITAEITNSVPKGMKQIGTRPVGYRPGKVTKKFKTNKKGETLVSTTTAPVSPVNAPVLVPKPKKGEGGAPGGRVDEVGNLVPQPVKARTGRVRVSQGTPQGSKEVLARNAKERRALRGKEIFGTRPDEGTTSGPVTLPKVSTKQKRINQAQRKIELSKPLPDNVPTPPGVSRQLTLPGINAKADSMALRKSAEREAAGPEKEMTGLEQLRYIKSQGGLAQPTPSSSKELELRPGGKGKARRDRKIAKKNAVSKTQAPVQLSLFGNPATGIESHKQGQQWLGGKEVKVSPETRELQIRSDKPRGKKINPYEKEADTLLDGTK